MLRKAKAVGFFNDESKTNAEKIEIKDSVVVSKKMTTTESKENNDPITINELHTKLVKNRAKELLIKARQLRDENQPVKAMELIVDVLHIDEYNNDAQFLMGFIYEFHVKDSLHDAIKWYSYAHANGNEYAEEAISRATAKFSKSDQAVVESEKEMEREREIAVSSPSYKKSN